MADPRFRNFATILYPDNSHYDYEGDFIDYIAPLISDLHLPCALSPLHLPEGDASKPHYHLMFTLDGKISMEQAKVLVDKVCGVGIEKISNKKSYTRYLAHLDEVDKIHYNPDDILQFGGICLDIRPSGNKGTSSCVKDLIEYVDSHPNLAPRQLLLSLIDDGFYDLVQYVQDHSYFVNTFILR